MRIAPAAITPVPPTGPAVATPGFQPSRRTDIALLDLHGVGFFTLVDTLTGYGRREGYDSLANARRAAFALSVGETSPAAGVYRSGSRFYVRALATLPGRNPHDLAGAAAQAATAPALLHFEGNAKAHFAWVRDPRLMLIVDGATRIWTRDAHHAPPA